jgi:predicted AlkP superfamily pyrophosphatase or phosphodiesterase
VILEKLAWMCRSATFIFFGAFALNMSAAPRAQHVFIISIDGGKPAVIAQSAMPVLNRLAREGAFSWTATTIYPSVTLPSHTSMLTGVGPRKHQVTWNKWKPRKGVVRVATVFAQAKAAGFSTAMFVGKEKFRHLAQPGTLDCFDYGQDLAVTIPIAGWRKPRKSATVLAAQVAQRSAVYILEHKPNLCFIHFTDTDDTGHKNGWGSPQQIRAFADVDAALAVVLKAIEDAGIADESVLIVTADHGGHRKTHGGKSPDDMRIPWIAWGKDVRKDLAITAPVSTCDTAATALWLLGVPVPAWFDGTPVTSAFR